VKQVSLVQQAPYARLGGEGVEYTGPHRTDILHGPVRVVLFGPQALQIARSLEMQAELTADTRNGEEWELLPVESDQNWGVASTQLVHALTEENALAIVALDRKSSHLAEQSALKTFVQVLALSDDKTLTSANIPWIFRLPAVTMSEAALRLVKAGAKRSGINPELLRDVLASGDKISGLVFLPTEEPVNQ
jgi:branched-chain amino acid transport system substrate-binding protein